MREIGSEFWDVPVKAEPGEALFPAQTNWYLSGRTALNAILDHILAQGGCRTAALPSWCCDSMIKPFTDHGIEVFFYPVYLNDDHRLVQDLNSTEACDIAMVLDYFGFRSEAQNAGAHKIVIRDLTHAVFSDVPADADYYFGSTRKWAGVWTGGFAWAKNGALPKAAPSDELHPYIAARKNAMMQKKQYIKEAENGEKPFLEKFGFAEEWLDDNTEVLGAAERDIAAVKQLDAALIRKKRRENAAYLLERIGMYAFRSELRPQDCPLFVPAFFPHEMRNALRSFLIGQQIYCPVHWPVTAHHRLTQVTQKLYDEELSIICDQRYDLLDMERICDAVVSFVNSYKGA